MNVLDNPNSVYQPSGEHAAPIDHIEDVRGKLNQAAQEMVTSAFASIPESDPSTRLERQVGPKPPEIIYLQGRMRGQHALRASAMPESKRAA